MTSALQTLRSRIGAPEALRRLGQALWMEIGLPLERAQLYWSKGLLGDGAEEILWSALTEYRTVLPPENRLDARRLAAFLGALASSDIHGEHRLVWTLPEELGEANLADSYVRSATGVISGAQKSLLIVSPFMEARGVGRLFEPLLAALTRGVSVSVVTHGAHDLGSSASAAIEELRREARVLPGRLEVFSAEKGVDLFVHAKLLVADEACLVLGSANVTGRGFAHNLEAGVVLGEAEARECARVVRLLIEGGLVSRVFSRLENVGET